MYTVRYNNNTNRRYHECSLSASSLKFLPMAAAAPAVERILHDLQRKALLAWP